LRPEKLNQKNKSWQKAGKYLSLRSALHKRTGFLGGKGVKRCGTKLLRERKKWGEVLSHEEYNSTRVLEKTGFNAGSLESLPYRDKIFKKGLNTIGRKKGIKGQKKRELPCHIITGIQED